MGPTSRTAAAVAKKKPAPATHAKKTPVSPSALKAANKTQREGRTTRAVSFARTHAQDAETAARAKDASDARMAEQTRTKDGAGVEGAAPESAEEAQNIQRGGGAERAPSERARTTRAETLLSVSATRKNENNPSADAAVVRDDAVAAEEYARFVAANAANALNPPGGPSATRAMPRASWQTNERDANGPPPAITIAGAASSGPSRGSLASNLSELTNDAARGGAAGAPALPPGAGGVARANAANVSYGFQSGRDAPRMDGARNVMVNPPPPFAVTHANGFSSFGDGHFAARDPFGFYVEHGSPNTDTGSPPPLRRRLRVRRRVRRGEPGGGADARRVHELERGCGGDVERRRRGDAQSPGRARVPRGAKNDAPAAARV